MTLAEFNRLPAGEAERILLDCCASRSWAKRMAAARPFRSREHLREVSEQKWMQLSPEDWFEAFAAHPPIGGRKVETASATSSRWSSQEQRGMQGASAEVSSELARLNQQYRDRFGYVFLVCATGKSGQEMLELLEERMDNTPEEELRIAAVEQSRITRIRLDKLLA